MNQLKIKKSDRVLVISGRDRAKSGKVISVDPKLSRAVVESVNIYKKHAKPSRKYPQGGIIDVNVPIKISNLMVICPACQKAVRIKYKNSGKDKRRICSKCKEVIDAT